MDRINRGEVERERERENTQRWKTTLTNIFFKMFIRILCLKLKNGKSEFKTHSSGVAALNHFL